MKPPVPVAVTTGSLHPRPTLESIQRLGELGIHDVELTLQTNEFFLTFERQLSMPILPELSALVKSGRLRVRSVHAPSMNSERSGYNLRARRELLIHAIHVCHSLGGKLMVIHPFHLFRLYEDAHDYLTGDRELSSAALLPGIDEVLDLARSKGIRLALENIQDWVDEIFFNVPQNVARLLRQLDHPVLGVTLDVIHAEISGFLDAFVDSLPADILNIHASDLLPPNGRVPIGEGVIDWDRLLPRLQQLPALQQITLELGNPSDESMQQSLQFLTATV